MTTNYLFEGAGELVEHANANPDATVQISEADDAHPYPYIDIDIVNPFIDETGFMYSTDKFDATKIQIPESLANGGRTRTSAAKLHIGYFHDGRNLSNPEEGIRTFHPKLLHFANMDVELIREEDSDLLICNAVIHRVVMESISPMQAQNSSLGNGSDMKKSLVRVDSHKHDLYIEQVSPDRGDFFSEGQVSDIRDFNHPPASRIEQIDPVDYGTFRADAPVVDGLIVQALYKVSL